MIRRVWAIVIVALLAAGIGIVPSAFAADGSLTVQQRPDSCQTLGGVTFAVVDIEWVGVTNAHTLVVSGESNDTVPADLTGTYVLEPTNGASVVAELNDAEGNLLLTGEVTVVCIAVVDAPQPVVTDNGDGTGTAVVPDIEGVQYLNNGANVGAGNVTLTGDGNLSAAAKEGFELGVYTGPWPYSITDAPPPATVVDAPQPVVTDNGDGTGTAVVPDIEGVQYLNNGANVGAGNVTLTGDGNLSAAAKEGFELGVYTGPWPYSIAAAPPPATVVDAPQPVVTDNGDGTGTAVVPDIEGVQYLNNGANVGAGNVTLTGDGNLSAAAKEGFELGVYTGPWPYSIAAAPPPGNNLATVTGHAPFSSEANHPDFWGEKCVKKEPGGSSYVLPAGTYGKVIVKAGATNVDPYTNTIFAAPPKAGQTVWADTNGDGEYNPGGKDGDKGISHVIICPPAEQSPSPTPTPTDTPSPTPEPSGTTTPSPEPSGTTTPSPEPSGTTTPSPEPSGTTTPSPEPSGTTTPKPSSSATSKPTPTESATDEGDDVASSGKGDGGIPPSSPANNWILLILAAIVAGIAGFIVRLRLKTARV